MNIIDQDIENMISIINKLKPLIEKESLNGFSFGHMCITRYEELYNDEMKYICMVYANALEKMFNDME